MSRISLPVLYVVRHGETLWNAEGRLQGQRDIPLSDVGRVQAEEAARKLRGIVPLVEDLAYVTSPMLRTRETMEILRGTLGLHPPAYRIDPRLTEIGFGAWEGLTWKAIRKADPELHARRQADKWGTVPPGGESYAMASGRVLPAVAELSRDAVIVAHGGVARVLLAELCGMPREQAPKVDIWQGRILVIRAGRFGWV